MKTFFRSTLLAELGCVMLITSCNSCNKNSTTATVDTDSAPAEAVRIIKEGAAKFGFDAVAVKCDQVPANPQAGDKFKCSATTADNKTLLYVMTMTDSSKFKVTNANVQPAKSLPVIVGMGAAEFTKRTGIQVRESDVDCGKTNVVYPNLDVIEVPCTVVDPGTKKKYNLTMSINKATKAATAEITSADGSPVPPNEEPFAPTEGDAPADEKDPNEAPQE